MSNKPVAIALVAHPDDIEIQSMGTLLQLQKRGWEIHYMTIANGCCGTAVDDIPTISAKRRQECQDSCAKSGAIWHPSVCNDLEVEHSWDIISKVLGVIREIKPSIVITQALNDYMEDHINSCRVAVTAAFCRGMLNAKCDPPLPPFQDDVTVYHTIPHGFLDPLRHFVEPEFFVNVTPFMEQKRELLACHKTQKEWLDISQGMDAYLNTMTELCEQMGKLSGTFQYAEGFIRHNHLGLCAPDADPLTAALKEDVKFNERPY